MSKVDYDKTYTTISSKIEIVADKFAFNFNNGINFVQNLRKHITNEAEHFESIVTVQAFKVAMVFLLCDIVLAILGFSSILGLTPKTLTVGIIYSYIKFRGGKLNGIKSFKKLRRP